MKAVGLTAVLAVLALTGCTADQVNMATQAVGVYNATRAGGTSSGNAESVGAALGIATPTSTQTRKVASLMTVNTGNAAVNMVMPEVASTMTPLLLAVSCHRTTGNELPPLSARYIASNASGRFTGALTGMTRHPNDRCADVVQLSGWSRSASTLAFSATFRSAQSGESQTRRYEMSKTSAGQWVFSAGN